MTRGDDIGEEDERYRPFPKVPFLVGAFAFILALLTWVGMALFALSDWRAYEMHCALVATGLILVALALPFALARIRTRRGLRGWVAKNEEAMSLLRAGKYREAATTWDALAVVARWAPAVHALLLHNLGVAWLHLGEPRRALSLMDRVAASGWFRTGALSGASVNLKVAHALAHVVVGDLDAAERLRDEVVAGLPDGRRGVTMLVDTMLGARRAALGDPPSQETLRLAEASLMPTQVRAIPILHAFAKAQGDGGYRTTDEETPRADGGGLAPGDLDFLAAEWPELAAYLKSRGLARP